VVLAFLSLIPDSKAGHGAISPHGWVNNATGFVLHTALFVPYYSWKHSHHLHHKSTGSIERDENFVPATRSDLKLRDPQNITKNDLKVLGSRLGNNRCHILII
jgi:hypothetical protein